MDFDSRTGDLRESNICFMDSFYNRKIRFTRTYSNFRYTAIALINAIFFDFDGILTTDAKGSLTVSKNLCAAVPGLSQQEVLECYRQDFELLNTGQRTMREVWERICSVFKIPADDALLQEILRKAPKNEAMFALARALSPHYALGIITDNSRERMDALAAEMALGDLFHPIVVSAIEHASKCDGTTTIFDAALAGAGCKADEAIFIDNQEKNLVTPAKMGMKIYLHEDKKNDMTALRTALRQMGIDLEDD